ncbi:hypothetical protein FJTKL_07954 [Diaporthe vaccinii]|uniref:Uncharacterized protein n=1 Tax=Diaporthe vaccinii TaxID=105482 RepID=A0ABR4FDY7_9PEZI
MPLKSLLTGPVYDSGEELMFSSFAERQRASTSNLVCGALVSDDADEIEEERDVRDVSEIIDSGEDGFCGEDVVGHLSICALPAAPIARLIEELLPKQCDKLASPGEGSRAALGWGVRRGVGSSPNVGGSRTTV